MSARREPQAPPDLPGFTAVELLGSGGFADVFLYEQHLPRRRVAVKVLLPERAAASAEFTAEANVMAMLSTHPAIVTIHQAGVSTDGRPYLVMEYCPKPNLQVRYRREPFGVAEALRVGIQVAAAVETAHRAGVLHRDIKPANILVTEYNRPALTDFGIATSAGAVAEAGGLSIPWSPPEAVAAVPASDARSDVYALGATVYTLLAGRSPFELPGQRNTGADVIERIESLPLPPLGRADVPSSLERTLQRTMAKAPGDRYDSAVAFARALQKVQIELAHAVTPIDILDDHLPDDVVADEDDGLTRVRGLVSIDPETAPAAGPTRPPASPFAPSPASDLAETRMRPPAADDLTLRRPPTAVSPEPVAPGPAVSAAPVAPAPPRPPVPPTDAASTPPAAPAAPRSRRGLWIGLSAGAVAAAAAVVLAVALPAVLGGEPAPSTAPTATDRPIDVVPVVVPEPDGLTGEVGADGVVFTWTNPEPEEGDRFLWGSTTPGAETELQGVEGTTVTVPADPSGTTCIEVLLRRANGQASEPATACAP